VVSFGDPRLSASAKAAFDGAANYRRKIVLSVISLHDPNHVLQEAPVTSEIIDAMREVPRVDIPDMPDRIVAATAVYFGVPAISRDGRIRTSNVQTVW
jgi:PIN domain nuclease of toxin-antitoxin system